MQQLEHTEHIIIQLSKHELEAALRWQCKLPDSFRLDDLEIIHEQTDTIATAFFIRPLNP